MAQSTVHACSPATPVVIRELITKWPSSEWHPHFMLGLLKDKLLQFRIGLKDYPGVQLETECEYVESSVQDFLNWVNKEKDLNGPFSKYSTDTHWCYLDYKHMVQLFDHNKDALKDVDWSVCGLANRDGRESTFWMGSAGANTPTHQDSYGCNLVAQIYGRKQWILFPPSDGPCLYPSRLPYEESSSFSQVNMTNPDLDKFPNFKKVTPHVITLEAGDVLFVPRHWWHYVHSLDTSISINTWVPMAEDDQERITEALARTFVMGLMSQDESTTSDVWINPNEEISPMGTNLILLHAAINERGKSSDKLDQEQRHGSPNKRTSSAKSEDGPVDSSHFGHSCCSNETKRLKLENLQQNQESCGDINTSSKICECTSNCPRKSDKYQTLCLNFCKDKQKCVPKYNFEDYLRLINYTWDKCKSNNNTDEILTNSYSNALLRTLVECVTDRDVLELIQRKLLEKLS